MTQRPISPLERGFFTAGAQLGSVPVGGMPLFIGSTIEGEFDLDALREVLDELVAGHPLLRCGHVLDDGVPTLRLIEGYRAPLAVVAGGEREYLRLVNERQDWTGGLFRAVVLRDGPISRIVLVIHHGISDGRSAFALLGELWRRYTARIVGTPMPIPDAMRELPRAVDDLLAETMPESEALDLLDMMRGMLIEPPHTLPRDGAAGDPLGRYAVDRIELDDRETGHVVAASRAAGVSVHSLLSGYAMAAVRAQFETPAALSMICGYAADIRGALDPALPESLVLNCASGAGTPLSIGPDADPIELARLVDVDIRTARERRDPARLAVAFRHIRDEATAAMFSAPPTIALSNIGRVPAHATPAGVSIVRDDIFAMGPGMPPKLTIFTLGDRLTIQVEYDTVDHSRTQLTRVREALTTALRGIEVPEVPAATH